MNKPPGWSSLERVAGYLMITCLVMGPMLVGSYFGAWRWPLVICSSVAAALLLFTSLYHKPLHWRLLILFSLPILQGLWMWYNTWGEFLVPTASEYGILPWKVFELDNQPFSALPGAPDRREAMDRLSYIIPCLGLIWGTRHLVIKQPKWCKRIALAIYWTGVFVALLGLLQRGTDTKSIYWSIDMNTERNQLFFGPYRSPGIAACFMNIALAFGLSSILATFGKKQWSKHESHHYKILHLLGTTIGSITITCGIVLSGSKAGMLLAILTVLLWLVINRNALIRAFHRSADLFHRHRRLERNIVLLTLATIMAISLLSFAGQMLERWQSAKDGGFSSLDGRMVANQVQMRMVAADDWGMLGYGPGSFYPLFPYYTEDQGEALGGIWVYAHNDYLQTLVEWGWFGGICFIAIIGGGFYLLTREVFFHRTKHSQLQHIYYRGYFVAILALLIHASVEFPLQIESIAVAFSVMLGVAWASVDSRRQDIRSRPRKS